MSIRSAKFAAPAHIAAVIAAVFVVTTCNDRPTETKESDESTPQLPGPRAAVTGEPVVLVGAGNIARCNRQDDEETAKLLDAIPGTVFTLGDNIYSGGSLADFQNCYGAYGSASSPSWGKHAPRTRPTPGDDDYSSAGAPGYFAYFGAAAGDPATGYYSYDLGSWHIIVLNSTLSMSASSAQIRWLGADLRATQQPCVLAYWHHPRFSSYGTATRSAVKAAWDTLYKAQADVVLNAHYRVYERFAPQTPTGTADPAKGIRQFTVGTGGHGVNNFSTVRPNSEARSSGVYGVLKLTLDATTYSWEFVPIAGESYTDTGSGACHGRPGGPPPPNQAPTADPGGPYSGEGNITFDGSGSSDIDNNLPLTYEWNFGDGQTGTGVAPTHTYGADGTYNVSLTVRDALDLASGPVATSVTIGNIAPTVNAGGDATVQLGSTFNLAATFTDPGGAGDGPWSWSIAWGHGSPQVGSTSTLGPLNVTHSFPAYGQYTVTVTVTDKDGGTGSDELMVNVPDPTAEFVLVGAGDIAACYQDRDEATAKLLDNIPGTVMILGDNVYQLGTDQQYADCYHPTWGRHRDRTKPSVGNHDYGTPNAGGYSRYFGALAGDPDKLYYSYDLGEWHIIVLNSGEEDSETTKLGSPQNDWLRADLAATTKACVLAYWHHPMFTSSSGRTTNNDVKPFWDALYEFGADVIVNGHDHSYERFELIRPDATIDLNFGIRAITAGTGGESLYSFGPPHPRTITRNNVAHGVLKMTLRAGNYDWEFIPIAGQTYTDRGTGTCHGRPGGDPPPNQPPAANAGGPYTADNTVTLSGTGNDPDLNLPITFRWTFHDGTTSSLASPTKTYPVDGSYTASLVVTDNKGLASAPSIANITIANVAPSVSAGPDAGREVGVPYALSATFTDPGGAADGPWSYTIAWGDGTTTPSEGSGSTSTSPIAASHAYAATGQYTVTVTVTDKDGGSTSDQAIVTVTAPTPNEPPAANAGGPYAADNSVTFSGSGSDPDGDVPLTFRWTFHDGTTSDVANPTRSYGTDGTYEATLVVTDAKGLASAPSVASVTIANVAPTVNAGADRNVQAGTSLSLSVAFTDAGGSADGLFSWFIDWGDGTRTPAAGTNTAALSPFSASHTYVAEGDYTAVVTVADKDGGSSSDAVAVNVTPPGASFVLVGAGNIARCDYTNDDATAALLDAMTDATVFATGDNIYGGGSLSDFQNCYGPNWGRHASRTRPAPGEEEYETAGAAGYFSYFGASAGSPGAGYYSYDLGAWHIVVLNSNIAMTAGSAQETWLRNDLTGTTKQCILAYWHHPRFSSYSTSVRPEVKPLWDALYAAGADVVVNGHYRLYERFAPQNPDGGADATGGIRQFTVGTGGHGVNSFGSPRPNSQVRISGAYGVLKLTLESNSYSWEFVPIAGQTFTDAGNSPCH